MQVKKIRGFFSNNEVTRQDLSYDLPMDADNWNCSEWKVYFFRVKNEVGEKRARLIVSSDLENVSTFSDMRVWCSSNCEWLRFAKKHGLPNFGHPFSFIGCGVSNVVEIPLNLSEDVKTLSNVAVWLGVPVAGYLIYKYLR